MTTYSWTVGENFSVMVDLRGTGNLVPLPLETGFDITENISSTTVDPLQGPVSTEISFKNWSGKIMAVRTDTTYDDYRDAIQSAKAAGVKVAKGSIHYSISENDGSTTDYLLSNVVFVLGQTAASSGKVVTETISWTAEARTKQ
jgi:hypothetical protein